MTVDTRTRSVPDRATTLQKIEKSRERTSDDGPVDDGVNDWIKKHY